MGSEKPDKSLRGLILRPDIEAWGVMEKQKIETNEICPVWSHRSSAAPGLLQKRKNWDLSNSKLWIFYRGSIDGG